MGSHSAQYHHDINSKKTVQKNKNKSNSNLDCVSHRALEESYMVTLLKHGDPSENPIATLPVLLQVRSAQSLSRVRLFATP